MNKNGLFLEVCVGANTPRTLRRDIDQLARGFPAEGPEEQPSRLVMLGLRFRGDGRRREELGVEVKACGIKNVISSRSASSRYWDWRKKGTDRTS